MNSKYAVDVKSGRFNSLNNDERVLRTKQQQKCNKRAIFEWLGDKVYAMFSHEYVLYINCMNIHKRTLLI